MIKNKIKYQASIIKKQKAEQTSSGNKITETGKHPTNKTFDVGEYCIVQFEGELWPGQITNITSPGSVQANAMKKQKHCRLYFEMAKKGW